MRGHQVSSTGRGRERASRATPCVLRETGSRIAVAWKEPHRKDSWDFVSPARFPSLLLCCLDLSCRVIGCVWPFEVQNDGVFVAEARKKKRNCYQEKKKKVMT